MSTSFLASMQYALDLVKSGQLMQATTAIQQALGGMQVPAANQSTSKPASDEHVVEGEVLAKNTEFKAEAQATKPIHSSNTPFDALFSQLSSTLHNLPAELPSVFKPAVTTPPAMQADAQFITRHYSNAYGTREYKLYIPSTYQGQTMPLAVMLHGCTQTADDFALGTAMNQLAEEFGCLIAYPNQNTSANPNRCWNWFKPQDQQRGQGEPSIIAGLTQAIMADYAVDKRRVYIAGLSAGGAMAAIMATTYPELYAALGVHSGLASGSATDLLSALNAMRQGNVRLTNPANQRFVPTIVLHGEQDTTVHAQNGEQIFTQARDCLKASNDDYFNVVKKRFNPTAGHAYTCTRLQDAKGNTHLEHWLIHGAGHAWAGGNAHGSYTDPQGPNASRAMLMFFLSHPH